MNSFKETDIHNTHYLPQPENVCQFKKGRINENGERVLLEELRKENHSLTLFPQLAGPQPCHQRRIDTFTYTTQNIWQIPKPANNSEHSIC